MMLSPYPLRFDAEMCDLLTWSRRWFANTFTWEVGQIMLCVRELRQHDCAIHDITAQLNKSRLRHNREAQSWGTIMMHNREAQSWGRIIMHNHEAQSWGTIMRNNHALHEPPLDLNPGNKIYASITPSLTRWRSCMLQSIDQTWIWEWTSQLLNVTPTGGEVKGLFRCM